MDTDKRIIFKNEVEEIKQKFLFHGFLCSPLTDQEIDFLLFHGMSHDEIYNTGCDVYNTGCDVYAGLDLVDAASHTTALKGV